MATMATASLGVEGGRPRRGLTSSLTFVLRLLEVMEKPENSLGCATHVRDGEEEDEEDVKTRPSSRDSCVSTLRRGQKIVCFFPALCVCVNNERRLRVLDRPQDSLRCFDALKLRAQRQLFPRACLPSMQSFVFCVISAFLPQIT